MIDFYTLQEKINEWVDENPDWEGGEFGHGHSLWNLESDPKTSIEMTYSEDFDEHTLEIDIYGWEDYIYTFTVTKNGYLGDFWVFEEKINFPTMFDITHASNRSGSEEFFNKSGVQLQKDIKVTDNKEITEPLFKFITFLEKA